MALFVIIPTSGELSVLDAEMKKFGKKAYKMPRGEWLVAFEGTSKQLSDEIRISNSETPLGVNGAVLSFSGYYGRAPTDLWEWISVNSTT